MQNNIVFLFNFRGRLSLIQEGIWVQESLFQSMQSGELFIYEMIYKYIHVLHSHYSLTANTETSDSRTSLFITPSN